MMKDEYAPADNRPGFVGVGVIEMKGRWPHEPRTGIYHVITACKMITSICITLLHSAR